MEKASQRIVIFLLIFSPIAFGSVEPWALLIMECGAFLALFLYLLNARHKAEKLYKVPGLLPLACFLGYLLFQLLPLPAFLVRILSPGIYQIYVDTVGVFQPVDWLPLTLNRNDTLLAFFRFGAYAAFYVLLIQLFSKGAYLKRVVSIVTVFAASLSIIAILQHFTADGKMFWFRDINAGTPFGPYVNRNHYAGFMEMVIPIVVALFLFLRPTIISDSFKEKIVMFFDHPNMPKYMLFGFGALVMTVSVFVCLSRGGIVALMLALALLGCLLTIYRSKTKGALILTLLCMLTMISVGWFGWDPIFERFNQIRNYSGDITENRLTVWNDSKGIINEFPLVGTGFGTFQNSYRIYRTLPGPTFYTHAHNDYLELTTDGGILGVSLMAWFLGSVFFRSLGALKKRREPYMIYIGCGAFAGISAILFHSVTDFNFHIGANGLYFFFLSALFVSAAHTRIRFRSAPSRLPSFKNYPSTALVISTTLLLGGCLFTNSGNFVANSAIFDVVLKLTQKDLPEAEKVLLHKKISQAAFWNPLNGYFPLFKADLIVKSGEEKEISEPFYQRAVTLSPSSALFHKELALYYTEKGKNDLADALFRASVKYAPMNEQNHRAFGTWLLDQGRIDTGLQLIQRAISLAPRNTESYIILLKEKNIKDALIERTLPDLVLPHIIFAEHLEKTGSVNEANAVFEKALVFLPNEKEVKPEYFSPIYKHYQKQMKPEKAIDVLRMATAHMPDNASVRLNLAKLYEDQGISYRAVEEYQKVLMIDPYHKTAKRRLAALRDEKAS